MNSKRKKGAQRLQQSSGKSKLKPQCHITIYPTERLKLKRQTISSVGEDTEQMELINC